MQHDMEKVRSTIMQLSALVDLIGLEAYIEKQTNFGRRPGPEPWTYTREALAAYAPKSDPDKVIELFEAAGLHNDIDAVRWIIRHDRLVP